MPTKLKVQILEDSAADAELILHELRRAGFDPEWKRVETEPDYLAQLDQGWEIVLADYNLPEFDGLRALQLLRGRDPDLPFILVSGTIGEDIAVTAMKAGANDYVMKHQLARLGPVVERELRDAVERRQGKQLAEALRKSEERYRTVSRLSSEFSYSCIYAGDDGYVGDWITNAFYTLTGYSDAELLEQKCWVFVSHPDDRKMAAQLMRELKAGESASREFRIVTKDGRVLNILSHMECQADPKAPGGLRLFGAVQDITERKQAEEKLVKSERRFRQLSELLPQIVFETDIKGTLTFANQNGLKSFGYSLEDIQSGINLFTLVAPEDRESIKGRLMEILSGSETTPREFQVMRKDGGKFPILMHANTILEGGVPIGIRGIGFDITERKRAEDELRKSEERFKFIFEFAPDAYFLTDLKGYFIDGNKAAEKMSGFNKEELIGGSYLKSQLLSLDQLPKAAKLLLLNAVGRPTGPDEFILKRKTGKKVHVEISTYPVKFENKTLVLGIARDITERRRGEEALRESEEKYRTLVENAAESILIAQDGRLKFTNRMASVISGYSEQELCSRPFLEFVHPDDRDMVGQHYMRRLKGNGAPARYAFRLINKDGSIKWVEIEAVLVVWEGKPATLNFLIDVTERKKAEDKLRETLGGLRNALGGIIQVLSAISEKRDPYTAGHQRRVADLSQAIGQEMGLAADRVEGLRTAGVIHDIGKLSIPAEILSKPARLSEIEYKMIQSHAQIGHDILGDVKFAWPIANIILQHHERLDGSGYPQGLKGDDIMLESRILAVSDVIEAMASHRPYRSALGIEAALHEIENNKGLLYDPAVVSACLTLFREKGYALKE
jgi:PAS domain S-box-containing protein